MTLEYHALNLCAQPRFRQGVAFVDDISKVVVAVGAFDRDLVPVLANGVPFH